MNEFLKTFFTPQRIEYEYISLDTEGLIVEFSPNVGKFSDRAEAVILGNEISLSFPEVIGLESIFHQLITGRISHFELKGISRDVGADSPLYFDIYIFKNEKDTHIDGEILVLLNDTTEWMIREQKYTQVYREYELSVSRLEQTNHYINQIIHSMNDMLLVTNSSGIITRLNKATQDLLEYREDELLHESII
ncbi:MAG: PAS domain-containing protein, partial [Cyanobacteriota bacterium]|nr:PAS domain-containing protein [Cyanobacteriota bacterium]